MTDEERLRRAFRILFYFQVKHGKRLKR